MASYEEKFPTASILTYEELRDLLGNHLDELSKVRELLRESLKGDEILGSTSFLSLMNQNNRILDLGAFSMDLMVRDYKNEQTIMPP